MMSQPQSVDEALWGRQDIFQSIWEHASDAMALSDAEGTVLAANPAYFRLYGYPAEAVIGHCFSIIFPPDQREWAIAEYKTTFADPALPPPFETSVHRPDGSERVVESRIEYLSDRRRRMVPGNGLAGQPPPKAVGCGRWLCRPASQAKNSSKAMVSRISAQNSEIFPSALSRKTSTPCWSNRLPFRV